MTANPKRGRGRGWLRPASLAVAASLLLPALPVQAGSPDRLQRRPFTVVAVVDSGINPYHRDFRRPELTAHPSTYIEGFPRSARALRLSLGAPSFEAALARDHGAWSSVQRDELVWIPGTNIIGGIDTLGTNTSFRDDVGHGTAVASVAGGRLHDPGSDDILIVAVDGFAPGLAWAADQPWIDIITNSWTGFDPQRSAAASRRAVESGKVVCFASGNLAAPLWFSGEQGPSWNLHVGAASSSNRGEHYYTGWPNDVLGVANVTAARHNSLDGDRPFNGTSAAAPHVCGLIGKTLSQVRRRARHWVQGPHEGALAAGRGLGGYMEDGRLTNHELIDAIQATAVPAEPNPPHPDDANSIPALPLVPWVRGGYGIVDRDSVKDALAVVLGRADRPDREIEDTWMATLNAIRDAVWGEPP